MIKWNLRAYKEKQKVVENVCYYTTSPVEESLLPAVLDKALASGASEIEISKISPVEE